MKVNKVLLLEVEEMQKEEHTHEEEDIKALRQEQIRVKIRPKF